MRTRRLTRRLSLVPLAGSSARAPWLWTATLVVNIASVAGFGWDVLPV